MTTPAGAADIAVRDALAEPMDRARRGWVTRMTVAVVGLNAGFFGPLQVLLAQQVAAFTPGHKESTLALVTGTGATISLIGNPVWGALSDRTTGRFGRRMPWIAGGALLGAAALVVLGLAGSIATVILGWCLVQAGLNAMLAATTAAIPDLVPVRQRAAVGGWVGVGQTMGVVAGTGIATAVDGVRAGYLTLAALVIATALVFVVRTGDVPLRADQRPRFSLGAMLRSFWVDPRQHPDFAWAWLTRFLVNVGNAIGTLYLLYYLGDAVGIEDPKTGVFVLILVYAGCLVATTVVAGLWSDRIGRRKPFVILSGAVTAVASSVLALFPTWPAAVTGAVILGIGFGVYTSVDFALVTQVLPSADAEPRTSG
ncbi:MAG: MFS transporter [Nostocoides sp.]